MVKCDDQTWLISYLCERIGLVPTSHIRAIGKIKEGKLIGVVGYDGWTGSACEMHMAGEPGWLTYDFIKFAFEYPFICGDCKLVIGKIPSGNIAALDIDKRLGFKEVLVLPDAHPDGALHILIMKREDCKWLEQRHGKEKSSTSTSPT